MSMPVKGKAGEYRFNPRPDMTLDEVIALLKADHYLARAWFVEQLPPNVARHFDLLTKDEE